MNANQEDVKSYPVPELVQLFQSISEEELTKEIVVPLFYALNYTIVDYHGGPGEGGKDLICWKTDEFNEPLLSVVQVKKYKPTAKAASSQSFAGLVNQLSQAIETPVPHLDGESRVPNTVCFITPFLVNTRSLQSHFHAYRSLRHECVRIVDGPALAKLVISHMPEHVGALLDLKSQVKAITDAQLTNKTLLQALQTSSHKHVRDFYTDIDLSLGRTRTRLLLGTAYSAQCETLTVNLSNWESIHQTLRFARAQCGVELLSTPEDQQRMEEWFKLGQQRFLEWQQEQERLERSQKHFDENAREFENTLSTMKSTELNEDLLDS